MCCQDGLLECPHRIIEKLIFWEWKIPISSDQRWHSGILIAAACQTQRDRYPGRCNVTDRCRYRCKVAQCEGTVTLSNFAKRTTTIRDVAASWIAISLFDTQQRSGSRCDIAGRSRKARTLFGRQMSASDQEFVRALIDMYRSLPCLWKVKSADYSNRHKKKAAYEKLVALYKRHHPTETVDENIVRKKIQALRTVHKKEMNKVKKSMKSRAGTDDVYVPKLWYYDLLAKITVHSGPGNPSHVQDRDEPLCAICRRDPARVS
ncbi:unnamed protein product [Ranitomeya imitator]|uniref:MADF domain-containing protein n=1 Tax=Ranitomeya imitator TaxID=111125 RepID=A0ABN9L3Y3_9NEOB|nr:unnamed protein product [Ranitomeya imitator]